MPIDPYEKNYEVEPEIPGVDPRIAALKDKPTVRAQPKQEFDMTATEVSGRSPTSHTFAHLIDRLERQLQYVTQLENDLRATNDRLSGAQPRIDNTEDKRPDVESYLQYSHTLVGDTHNHLVDLEAEIKRLSANLGE